MTTLKTELHPRNRHREPYDFKRLIKNCPDLAEFVATNTYGNESIDFSDPIAKGIIKQNDLTEAIEIRLQQSPSNVFKGIISDQSAFDASMCNPPFHATLSQAKAGTTRKWKNLMVKTNVLNFGGQSNELWCPGGEIGFIKRMIDESIHVNCKWFTTLVSKASSLSTIYHALEKRRPRDVKTIPMGQGQKKSRIVAWTFI